MIVTIIIAAIFLGIPIAILVASDAMKVRKVPKHQRKQAGVTQRNQTRSTLISLVFAFGFVALFASGIVPRAAVRGGLMLLLIAVPLLIAGVVLYAKVKYRKSFEAAALANAGDVEGGILEIQRALEEKPDSADLWNTLAVLLTVRQNYEQALEALHRAKELGLNPSLLSTNRTLILWKLGRIEEALALNTAECETNPHNFNAAVNQCHILFDLGRHDEARQQLQAVEKQPRILFPGSERKRRRELLWELHERLQSGNATDVSQFD